VGALPLVNRLLERMRLREILSEHLPADDPRTELSTASALLVLVRNVLLSRRRKRLGNCQAMDSDDVSPLFGVMSNPA
jgi:hypothetical protein